MKKYIVRQIYSELRIQIVEADSEESAVAISKCMIDDWKLSEKNTRYKAEAIYTYQTAKEE